MGIALDTGTRRLPEKPDLLALPRQLPVTEHLTARYNWNISMLKATDASAVYTAPFCVIPLRFPQHRDTELLTTGRRALNEKVTVWYELLVKMAASR